MKNLPNGMMPPNSNTGILGWGKTFKTNGAFEGWVFPMTARGWYGPGQQDGINANCIYAADLGSLVWLINHPEDIEVSNQFHENARIETTPAPDSAGERVTPDEYSEILRRQAKEIRQSGHAGWGNASEWAADAMDAISAKLTASENRVRVLEEALRLTVEADDAAIAELRKMGIEPEPGALEILQRNRAALAQPKRGEGEKS